MKVSVCGAAGRMGRRIVALAGEHPKIDVVGAVEVQGHSLLGADAGDLAGLGSIGVALTDDLNSALSACDVLIDFTVPDLSVANVLAAAKVSKAIVVGTTGFSESQLTEILTVGSSTRCLVAPNMSMGVNLLYGLVEQVAATLDESYHVEIIEAHHAMKKDAPSGTANKLGQIIAETRGKDLGSVAVFGREGMVGTRTSDEMGMLAVRGGDIVGEHTVMFVTNGERIELVHRAHSRDAFARGAIRAALWLVPQPIGLYEMRDVLGL